MTSIWFGRIICVLSAILSLLLPFKDTCKAQNASGASLIGARLPASSTSSIPTDTIPLTSGMLSDFLPTIPNLQFGFQYFFGNNIRTTQANADYLLPYKLGSASVLFGEARGNYWNFGQQRTNGASNRVDLSVGGGYRSILADKLLVGVNGFYDTSRLFNNWYSSGSVGLEMAANVGSSDAFDLNAN